MDVSTILGGATPAASPAASTAKSVLSTDFEVFLTMLTAQAEYQDPLEPMDS
ncbi:MAG: flagellar hook capping FlgD N-terminal domain-containing protein, partial [Pseudomonadota bacterium]